jgi:uncharacterized membrane protein
MKKLWSVLFLIAVIITAFFVYENYNFHQYITHTKADSLMNIPINEDAPVVSKSEMEIPAPIENVWNVLTNISNWPQWQKSVTETKMEGEISEGTNFKCKANGLSFKSNIHTA